MNDAAQRRLIDRLRPDISATGEVRRVLATTHDLDAEFFDGDFLCTALSIAQSEYSAPAGQLALQRKLASLDYAGVLCEATAFERRPNLRTVVSPVALRGACLHAKLVVVEYEHAVRLLIGSANLTKPGYRENREIAGEHFAEERNPERAAQAATILRDARETLSVFQDRAPEFLEQLGHVIRRLEGWAGGGRPASAVVWSDGARPLYRALLAGWPAGAKVERIRVVSPFWCEDGSADTPLRRLLRELVERNALGERCAVELFVESVPLTGGGFEPKEPLCLYYRDFPAISLRVIPVSPTVDSAELDAKLELTSARRLHAKILVLESSTLALAYAGSANFTRRGFGLRKGSADGSVIGNIEAGWVLELSPSGVPALLPPRANEGQLVPSLEEPGRQGPSEDDEPAKFWPFELLSVEVGQAGNTETMTLTARFADGAPAGWSVRVPGELGAHTEGETLFTTPGGAAALSTTLSLRLFRTLLRERHVLVAAPAGEALFPINIAPGEARDRLPLSSGTAVPSERELLEYYQGKLTFEDLFEELDAARMEASATRNDASGGVDTSQIQAYQIRAFVDALPGIRNELRDLRGSRGLLYQSFLGAVSPLAIARAVSEQVEKGTRSPTAAAFQLVELGMLLDSLAANAPAGVEHYAELCESARIAINHLIRTLKAGNPAELSTSSAFARYEAHVRSEAGV